MLERIVEQHLSTGDVKVSPEELQEVLEKMRNVQEVQEHVAEIIKADGDNLEVLDSHIDSTYDQVKNTNKELNEANQISIATRIMKIRLLTGGILAAIGSRLFGFFGMIGGLFAGFKVGSALKH